MYLSDRDIKSVLPELHIATDDPDHPFVAKDQIQPCSIDLRVDKVFWKQRFGKVIDLRRSKLYELSPRRFWIKNELTLAESITIKPGEMVLGRTLETFHIPAKYAGKLEGRSSFARMGLAVHCSADFINPGWRGRMPLQLVNQGKHTIRIFPFLPICQLILIPLSSEAEKPYGNADLSHKYMADEGGPSFWWRDKRIQQLQKALGENDVTERIQSDILDTIGPSDPDLIERFENMVRRLPREALTNAGDLLDRFAKFEDKTRVKINAARGFVIGLAPILISCAIGSLFSIPFGGTKYIWLHYVLWTMAVVSIPISFAGYLFDPGEYFGTKQLESLRREKNKP